jgi:shikimate dehydrogenase
MMESINGETDIYGIIGQPIAHSLSPLFQNQFIQNAKQNACYLPFLVEPEHLEAALQGLHAAHIQGLNVTVPHKENILPWVNADADAQAIGAVNTLKRISRGWQATNTDWQGFASVIQGLQVDASQAPVLLFGAGGTSRAILHALHHRGAKEVYICNRNQDRAKQLITSLASTYPNMQMHTLAWSNEAVGSINQETELIINSTSIGLKDADVFPFQLLGNGVAIDAVYKPNGNTAFCAAASGYQTVDGLPMLIAQGIASFAFWHAEKLQSKALNLPNSLESLQWVERKLSRKPLSLPGWRINT